MSDPIGTVFWLFFLAIAGSFVWRYFRSGSLTGALLGGTIESTLGEITLSKSGLSSSVLKVHVLRDPKTQESFLGLSVVSKASLGANMVPVKLSRSQTKELQALLQQADSRLAV
jgi:hypothetical protein